MKQFLSRLVRAYLDARQREADALVLEHLDARTLKDIGLESWKSEAGRAVSARQRQEALAWRAALHGLGGGLR